MNGLPARPPNVPLPPPEGAFRRVRRRALLRRLRVPAGALGAVAAAAVAGALVVSPAPQGADSLAVIPTTVPTTTPSATPETSPSLEPEPTAAPSPSTSSPTPLPSGGDAVQPPFLWHDKVIVVVPPDADTDPDQDAEPEPDPEPTASPIWDESTVCGPDGPGGYGPDITGVVVDRDGNPVPNATVFGGVCTDSGTVANDDITKTDANGRFTAPCLRSYVFVGPFTLDRSNARSTDAPVGYDFLGNDDWDTEIPCGSHHDVVLPDAATIEVQVVDSDGDPVSGSRQVDLSWRWDLATTFLRAMSDESGRATFTGLAPDYFSLSTGNGEVKEVTVAEGQTVQATVVDPTAPTASAAPRPA